MMRHGFQDFGLREAKTKERNEIESRRGRFSGSQTKLLNVAKAPKVGRLELQMSKIGRKKKGNLIWLLFCLFNGFFPFSFGILVCCFLSSFFFVLDSISRLCQ
jgi:hypothetical protein